MSWNGRDELGRLARLHGGEFVRLCFFAVILLTAALGTFARIADALPRKAWGIILKKSFPTTMVLFALSGFLSVKYDSCGTCSYQEIVTDHVYMIARN